MRAFSSYRKFFLTARPLLSRAAIRARGVVRNLHDKACDLALGVRTEAAFANGAPDPADRNARNEPISYGALSTIRSHLTLAPDDVFYDIGCAFGRALGYFARAPIARCVGIELRPEVARQAIDNARRLRGRHAD